MRADGLRARGKRKFKATTDSSHALPVSPNLLERKFDVEQPNRFWRERIARRMIARLRETSNRGRFRLYFVN